MHLPRALLCAALLLPTLAASCSRGSAENGARAGAAGAVQKREAPRVRTSPVVRREVVRKLSTTALVESEREVQILAQATGVVTQIFVEEGARVRAGELLARIDDREAKVGVRDAEVGLREAEEAVEKAALAIREAEGRAEALRLAHRSASQKYERNLKARLISEQDLELLLHERDTCDRNWQNAKLEVERAGMEHVAAQTRLERSRLALEKAQVALSHTEIRAFFEGVIVQRSLQVGDNASAGSPAFRLTDLEKLRVVIHRPQRELALFVPPRAGEEPSAGGGIEILASAEALPGKVFRGQIQRISPSIERESGAFRVTIGLEQAEDGTLLLPGMLLRLELVVERRADALVVEKRALRREGDSTILFVVRAGRAERIEVAEGFDDEAGVEVIPRRGATLAPGEPVVVVGNRDLEPGDEVTLANEAPLAPGTEVAPAAAGDEGSGASDG